MYEGSIVSAASNAFRAGSQLSWIENELAQVVVDLRGVRLVADALLELDLRRVEPADDHQVAAEDLVRFGVA